jgi:hypothetical protein
MQALATPNRRNVSLYGNQPFGRLSLPASLVNPIAHATEQTARR